MRILPQILENPGILAFRKRGKIPVNKKNFLESLSQIAADSPRLGVKPKEAQPEDENFDTKRLISGLRGEIPDECDFCHSRKPPEELEPEEGGQWACWDCLGRWAEQDRRAEEKRIKKQLRH
jgi:hypothetical protein